MGRRCLWQTFAKALTSSTQRGNTTTSGGRHLHRNNAMLSHSVFSTSPKNHTHGFVNTAVSNAVAVILSEEIKTVVKKKKKKSSTSGPRFRDSYFFFVPKTAGELRPILVLWVLNKYLRMYTFSMLTLRQLSNAVFQVVDLQLLIWQILTSMWQPPHRQFLRFAFA